MPHIVENIDMLISQRVLAISCVRINRSIPQLVSCGIRNGNPPPIINHKMGLWNESSQVSERHARISHKATWFWMCCGYQWRICVCCCILLLIATYWKLLEPRMVTQRQWKRWAKVKAEQWLVKHPLDDEMSPIYDGSPGHPWQRSMANVVNPVLVITGW